MTQSIIFIGDFLTEAWSRTKVRPSSPLHPYNLSQSVKGGIHPILTVLALCCVSIETGRILEMIMLMSYPKARHTTLMVLFICSVLGKYVGKISYGYSQQSWQLLLKMAAIRSSWIPSLLSLSFTGGIFGLVFGGRQERRNQGYHILHWSQALR